MNSLSLRINRSGCTKSSKTKNNLNFEPLILEKYINYECKGKSNQYIQSFVKSNTTEKQLSVLREIFEKFTEEVDPEIILFLVLLFIQAEPKHPVKCFVSRQISKQTHLEEPFSKLLSKELLYLTNADLNYYKKFENTVVLISTCIENFPAGANAVKSIELDLVNYLRSCLDKCLEALRLIPPLSPTEKNEVFNLTHLTLRLLLHIAQKTDSEQAIIIPKYIDVRLHIKQLLFDDEVPMDTKSVCGILYLSLRCLEFGPDSWIEIFEPPSSDIELSEYLVHEASRLALYSAIATVVCVIRLQSRCVDNTPALITLTQNIVNIGERTTSESSYILAVARTLLQISKMLSKIHDHTLGQEVSNQLYLFTWANVEHFMDSVRHLSVQIIANITKHAVRVDKEGHPTPLHNLIEAMKAVGRNRKGYYTCLTSLINELGASVMERLPTVIPDVLEALNVQAVQASATTALESLLQKHCQVSSTELIYSHWVQPILDYASNNQTDTGILNILEALLTKAVKLDENLMTYILPHIKHAKEKNKDLKCVLMLLNVARKSGQYNVLTSDNGLWKGIIEYEVLENAAVDAVDETRILSLTLIVESPKSTEAFTSGDLNLILYYLKYNMNAQAPNFRQLTLSVMKKFVKRFEDSYKVLKKQNHVLCESYISFMEDLRQQCFDSLIDGANYSRRFVALHILMWVENIHIEDYNRTWKREYIEKLLLHLEDSYEGNKSMTLGILYKCPSEIIEGEYTTSLKLSDVLNQASSLKPTDCVSAAYKLHVLRNKLPHHILQGKECTDGVSVTFTLIHLLLSKLRSELAVSQQSIVSAARQAPMYGLVHCIERIIDTVDPEVISENGKWDELINNIINTCFEVNAAVACVVNNSSPEGHLPMDMSGVVVTDEGNSGGVRLDDGRQVTAQMVLLCAWRSVKEVSLLLGTISSRLTIAGEGRQRGTLSHEQLLAMGEHFTALLAETKHRGAFEQAYVGFTKLLARLWQCRSPSLHSLPRSWLDELMGAIADDSGALCATRRSAGLPFLIQALVTTELQVLGSGSCFHRCMGSLLRLASGPALHTRTHAGNILRALFRNSALHEPVAGYVGDGLVVAFDGFNGDTWTERNSSTLLFSALMVRIFGVQRSRHDALCVRNRMTGRIFFQRYPKLYDYMLDRLSESRLDESQTLRPSLHPILLLLARLYPSSLEGTVSNLKLSSFIPLVRGCAGGTAVLGRRLAGCALAPLVGPAQFVQHAESMLQTLGTPHTTRNHCHGVILQLISLIDVRPETLTIEDSSKRTIREYLNNSLWILRQASGDLPCYLIADDYTKLINGIVTRLPIILDERTKTTTLELLSKLIFNPNKPVVTSGREMCLANATFLYFILMKHSDTEIVDFIFKTLQHSDYEVKISVLDYILILFDDLETENKFHATLKTMKNDTVLDKLRKTTQYKELLCSIYENSEYLECKQKSLKILTLEKDTQHLLIRRKLTENVELNDKIIIETLIDCVQNEHENFNYFYMKSLVGYIKKYMDNIYFELILNVVGMIFSYSTADNNEAMRQVVVEFLEVNLEKLLKTDLSGVDEADKFEFQATLLCTAMVTLDDESDTLRQRTANMLAPILDTPTNIISSKCANLFREYVVKLAECVPLYILFALLDFHSEVCLTDEGNDECRVFDQNERYNIFLEEAIWTCECADKIIENIEDKTNILDQVLNIIDNPLYKKTFDKLANDNIDSLKSIISNCDGEKKEIMNPKIKVFVNKLTN